MLRPLLIMTVIALMSSSAVRADDSVAITDGGWSILSICPANGNQLNCQFHKGPIRGSVSVNAEDMVILGKYPGCVETAYSDVTSNIKVYIPTFREGQIGMLYRQYADGTYVLFIRKVKDCIEA